MKSKEKEEVKTVTEKSETFGTVFTITTTEANQGKEQAIEETTGHQYRQPTEARVTLVELGELMSKLD